MKHFILLFLLNFTCSAFSQEKKETPTMEVIGRSEKYITPDRGILYIQAIAIEKEFNQAITALDVKTKDISKQLIKLGFKDAQIKTRDFQVNVNKIYRKDQYIDSGYIATQKVEVEFVNSKEMIRKMLSSFAGGRADFSLSFAFNLSDSLKARTRNELIRMAVSDAKDKAGLIAASGGIKLKRISNVIYGNSDYYPVSQADEGGRMSMMSKSAEDVSGFTPKDIFLKDQVIIRWELE